jgi:hypothetical protein
VRGSDEWRYEDSVVDAAAAVVAVVAVAAVAAVAAVIPQARFVFQDPRSPYTIFNLSPAPMHYYLPMFHRSIPLKLADRLVHGLPSLL